MAESFVVIGPDEILPPKPTRVSNLHNSMKWASGGPFAHNIEVLENLVFAVGAAHFDFDGFARRQ